MSNQNRQEWIFFNNELVNLGISSLITFFSSLQMVSSRLIKRVCIAGLTICLIYILLLVTGPLQRECTCDQVENSVPSESQTKRKESGHFLCLIVPYRERFEELTEFVPQMTAFLHRKNIPHYIFIINQVCSLEAKAH